MKLPDLVLIHAPSTFRNPAGFALHGMITASVPSTPVVEMYPLGFLSIASYLENRGYSVAIRNLALVSSVFPWCKPARFIPFLRGRVVGIDLQWAGTTDGALETARAIKRHSPSTPVVFGGLTASHFWRELLEYPQVDFVLRGDSTELPFFKLLEALRHRNSLHSVPNLAWRSAQGVIETSGIMHVPASLDEQFLDYGLIFRGSARRLDPLGPLWAIPYRDWLANPSAAVLTQKGCRHGCLFCGGSATAYASHSGRRRPAVKSPPAVIRELKNIAEIMKARVFLTGDLRDPGEEYAKEIFENLEKENIDNPLIIETMSPAPKEYFDQAVKASEKVVYQISADTHDDSLRRRFGRRYTSNELEETLGNALKAGCKNVRVFFGIGMPGQDKKSVMETVDYCESLLERFGGSGRFHPFISAYLPFMEPGSRAFRAPEKHGYKNYASTLEDFARLARQPSWRDTLGYRTGEMSRIEIVETAYEAAIALNRIHEKYGLIPGKARKREELRLKRELDDIRSGTVRKKFWLEGESSLYSPGLRGNLKKLFLIRPMGIIKESIKGLAGINMNRDTRPSSRKDKVHPGEAQ